MPARFFSLPSLLLASFLLYSSTSIAQPIGVFDQLSDIGPVLYKGNVNYNGSTGEYAFSGAGNNIWYTSDDFHLLWKRLKGDFILQARGKLLGKGVEAHRKFGWMVRSSLDTNAAMVSAAVHGDGLTALQYRPTKGSHVAELRSEVSGPDVIQLERRGKKYIMSVAKFGDPFEVEQVMEANLPDDVYAGLFICAHNKNVVEEAVFDNVRIILPAKENFEAYRQYIGSHIETMDVFSGQRLVHHTSPVSLQAPNWTPDGKALLYNSNGLMYRYDIATGQPAVLPTGDVIGNNNDHVISFDGKMLGLSSSSSNPNMGSRVYTVPISGGTPTLITPLAPSYLHGWSPDGKFLTYTAERNNKNYDIYKIPSTGGDEIRLTSTEGLDDGSEYSPDGKYIYFNSVRSGTMQIWRMKEDGSEQTQLTNDGLNNWFPHISPDGKWIVFLSFRKDVSPGDHPFYKHVYLQRMPVTGGKSTVIAYIYGGQATINTPSWAPNSKRIAFVSNTEVK